MANKHWKGRWEKWIYWGLEFFNQQIIEGNIAVNEQGVFSYQSEQDKLSVPMYLASSMINELVPLHLALTTRLRYRRLVIDEIESSYIRKSRWKLCVCSIV